MRAGILVYISGAISPKNGYLVEENVAAGFRVFIKLTQMGISSYCPHLTAAFPSAHSEVSYKVWMDYDLEIITHCTHMLMLPNWNESVGARQEREFAESLEMPVVESIEALVDLLDAKE